MLLSAVPVLPHTFIDRIIVFVDDFLHFVGMIFRLRLNLRYGCGRRDLPIDISIYVLYNSPCSFIQSRFSAHSLSHEILGLFSYPHSGVRLHREIALLFAVPARKKPSPADASTVCSCKEYHLTELLYSPPQTASSRPAARKKWNAGAVKSILINKKYKGDALLQKTTPLTSSPKRKRSAREKVLNTMRKETIKP